MRNFPPLYGTSMENSLDYLGINFKMDQALEIASIFQSCKLIGHSLLRIILSRGKQCLARKEPLSREFCFWRKSGVSFEKCPVWHDEKVPLTSFALKFRLPPRAPVSTLSESSQLPSGYTAPLVFL